MQKKIVIAIAIFLVIAIIIGVVLAIPRQSNKESEGQVLASFYPVYLIAANLLQGLPYDIDYLEAAEGGCAHDYLLTPTDRLKVENADVIIRIGAGMDDYLVKAGSTNSDALWIEGASILSSAEYLYYNGSNHHHHEEGQVNGHFFVSPRLYWEMSKGIGKALKQFVKEDEVARLEENMDAWQLSLMELQAEVQALSTSLKGMTIMTQHPAFDYLAKDLGIRIVGVLQENEGQEISSAHLMELIEDIKQEKVEVIVCEPKFSSRLPETLESETGVPSIILDPVSTTGSRKLDDYSVRMKKNFETLKGLRK